MIPTLDRADVLRETLDSLAGCDPLPHELIVVDGSPVGAVERVVSEFAARDVVPVRYVRSARGASVQRNRGIDAATGDVILFADDDVFFDRELFTVLAEAYRDDRVVGATGHIIQTWRDYGNEKSRVRRLLFPGGREGSMTRFGYPRRIQALGVEHDVESMQGCLMSVRRNVADEVRFDERLGPPDNYARLEDEDFSYRVSRRGRVRYLPAAVVHHRNMGFHSRSPRYFGWLIVVDRAYLFRKNFRATPLARVQFATLIIVLALHRAVNLEWAGVRGIIEGAVAAWREGRRDPRRERGALGTPPARV